MIDHMLLEQTSSIYSRLDDELSRKLYDLRIEYSITHDNERLEERQLELLDGWKLRKMAEFIDKSHNKDICIFGAGNWGSWSYNLIKKTEYSNYNVFYVDNNKSLQGKCLNGCKILAPEWLQQNKFTGTVLIQNAKYWPDIYKQCCQLVNRDQIYVPHYGKLLGIRGMQYFDVFKPEGQEVFVDVGSYDGADSIKFAEWCHKNYKKIYIFEPNDYQAEISLSNLKEAEIQEFDLVRKGAWSSSGEVGFSGSGMNMGTIVSSDTEEIVKVDTIDNVLKGEKATFIKMDVEGSELEALKGAQNTICNFKPKLAICIYHKPEDIWTIPSLILEYDSTYRFKVRQYQTWYAECVLYAY